MKNKTLEEQLRRLEELEEYRDAEGSVDAHEPPRYSIRIVPESIEVEPLSLDTRTLLARLPRCYEWTVVPGPEVEQ